jgi:hypothetical protein
VRNFTLGDMLGFVKTDNDALVSRVGDPSALSRPIAGCCGADPSSEAMINLTMIDNISERMADESIPEWRGTYWQKRE